MKAIEKKQRILRVHDGRFSYLAAGLDLGWLDIGFKLGTHHVTGEGGFEYESRSGAETLASTDINPVDDGFEICGQYATPGLEETVSLRLMENGALRAERRITNTADTSRTVRSAAACGIGSDSGPVFTDNHLRRARFCHLDNLRTEKYPFCRPEYPYIRTLPRKETVFGNLENQPVPAIILTNDTYSELLLEGQLRQDRTRLNWTLSAGAGRPPGTFVTHWSMASGGFDLAPGETIELEPIYYQILRNTHPKECWNEYFEAVIAENDLLSGDDTLFSKGFYCSWNYGGFTDISEERLLKTARFIADSMPGIKHFLIDAGWQGADAVRCPSCSNFYLPENQWHNAERFPQGMKATADGIRETGLSPAIWWTPAVGLHTKLAREHPEWLAKDASGNVFRIGKSGYLDYSLAPARDYLNRVFDILFNQWGFEAMKMDFWSHSVESENIRYATGTGVMWRDWLLSTIRSYLPEDGFLMTCVAVAMGNPFLGKAASTYRCSIDIGAGTWHEHVTASIWNLPLQSIPGNRTCLINVDGLGWNTELSHEENLHRLTYGFITMGSLEIDGRLEELPSDKIALMNRLLENMDRGHPVRCPDDDAFTGLPLPKALYVDYPPESLSARRGIAKHIALFNWTDRKQLTGYAADDLGLEGTVRARDFWTDETEEFDGGDICLWLPPRSARLYEIPA